MARYWIFDAEIDEFVQCTKRKALDEHDDMPVIIYDNGELIIQEEGNKRRWPSGDHYEWCGQTLEEDTFLGVW